MKKIDYNPVSKEKAASTLESLYKNRDVLNDEIKKLESALESGDSIPFEVVQQINNLGIFINNCALYLGYIK